ncbi:MAG: response regulator [Deltaproteobacteria bacterium]|nr:response regulator [Candidatus Anaeroferrophillus wilburensis]MBN2889443.1 response regulator [Deltaproteobacteria bacterium]
MNKRLLVLDDELEIREVSVAFFSNFGFQVDAAASGNAGITLLEEQDYDVVITDLMMPDGDGEKVLAWVMKTKPYIGVIVLTGYGSVESAVNLMKMGAADYVLKPFMLPELKVVVERCISRQALKEENRLLKEAYAKMQEVKVMKEKFLDLTSHELKTPVTIINTILDLVEQHDDGACLAEQYLPLMKKTVASLTRTVGELNQLVQSREGMLPITIQEIEMAALIEEVIDDIKLLAADRKLRYAFNGRGKGPFSAFLDQDKIRQTLFELLQNAVKYTPDQGLITVDITCNHHEATPPTTMTIRISDAGIGIAPEEQEKIFEKFYKIQDVRDHSSSESAFLGGGMGVGLSLAQGLIHAQGGSLTVESSPGAGSTFIITLPCRALPASL